MKHSAPWKDAIPAIVHSGTRVWVQASKRRAWHVRVSGVGKHAKEAARLCNENDFRLWHCTYSPDVSKLCRKCVELLVVEAMMKKLVPQKQISLDDPPYHPQCRSLVVL